MSYHLPLKIKQTKVAMVHFAPEDEYTEARIFLMEDTWEILHFFPEAGLIMNPAPPDPNPPTIDNLSYYVTDEYNPIANLLTIHIEIDHEGRQRSPETSDNVFFDQRKLALSLTNHVEHLDKVINDKCLNIHVDFSITINHRPYKGSLYFIHLSKRVKITNMNVDLGSDSTQIAYYYQGSDSTCLYDIIRVLLPSYATRAYTEANISKLAQYDPGAPRFFKTGMVSYKEPLSSRSPGDLERPVGDPDQFLNLISGTSYYWDAEAKARRSLAGMDEEEKFQHRLPNLKVCYQYRELRPHWMFLDDGGILKKNSDDNIQFLSVFDALYKMVISKCLEYQQDHTKFINLLMLVPNIYSQTQIDNLAYRSNLEFNRNYIQTHFQNGNLANNNSQAPAFQISVVSESDAVLLGLLQRKGEFEDKMHENKIAVDEEQTFLIIDSGKGTTDFSIIKTGAKSYISLRRGGIVGAGAVIDFLFLDIFSRILFADVPVTDDYERLRRSLFRLLSGIDIEFPVGIKDLLTRFVEKLKIDYLDGEIWDFKPAFANFIPIFDKWTQDPDDTARLDDVLTEIRTIFSKTPVTTVRMALKEEYIQEIDQLADQIVGSVLKQINPNVIQNVDVVILTGRSFLFQPLRNAVEKKITLLKDNLKTPSSGKNNFLMKTFATLQKKVNNALAQKQIKLIDFGYDAVTMKKIAVDFTDNSSLNVNFNTNLLNLDLPITSDFEAEVEERNFIHGFQVNTETVFYIGYMDMPFTKRPAGRPVAPDLSWHARTIFPAVNEFAFNNLGINYSQR